MLLRQVVPLLLLYADKGRYISGRTRFQKMIFLAQKEGTDVEEWYSFFPYDFGPYSAELQNDLDVLAGEELITESPEHYGEKIGYQYFLTKKGENLIKKVLSNAKYRNSFIRTLEALITIKTRYRFFSLEMIINEVYRKYPEYATFSRLSD
ncbi:MAG: hypothetical protein V3T58_01505 [Candidatus Hydrothermarchaeales archaeon]